MAIGFYIVRVYPATVGGPNQSVFAGEKVRTGPNWHEAVAATRGGLVMSENGYSAI